MVKTISPQTEKSVRKMTGVFGSKRPEEEKVKTIDSDNKTASKIVPLPEEDGLMDMLSRIYSFMKRNYEGDILRRQKESNFREESELEDQKRHDRLMEVIKNALKNRKDTTTTIEKIEEPSGLDISSIIQSILDAFGGAKTAIDLLKKVGSFFKTPLGGILISGVAAGVAGRALIEFLKSVREEDKMNRPQDYEFVPYDVSQQTGETPGQVGQRQKGQAVKQVTPQYAKELLSAKPAFTDAQLVEETGLTRVELEEELRKNPRKNIMVPVAPKEAKAVPMPTQDEGSPYLNGIPPTSAVPVSSTATSDKLNQAVAENVDNKIDALIPNEPVPAINNVIASSKPRTTGSLPRTPVPSVRNDEPTYQQMIYYSTRVV